MIKFNIWSLGSLIIAAIVLLPIIALFWMAFTPSENIWPHLISTTLPRYASNSAILMLSVGALSAAMGTGSAFLMVMYRFPGQKWLQWALLLPLAVPAYIGAYALVDFLEYAGPVQTSLRSLFGWQNARDYWFPEIRSVFFAVIVLSASLYPYVYLMTRSALEEQSGNSYEVARALGAGPIASLMRVAIPLARPAIAAASAIVMMEVVSDFGTSDFFAVQTLTTGIFTIWLDANNAAGAAQIACLILIVVLTLLGLEKGSRRNMRLAGSARNARPISKNTIHGAKGYILFALCFIPFFIGFLLPFSVILWNASKSTIGWAGDGLSQALLNTLFTGGMAAAITVLAALFLVYGVRLSQSTTARTLLPATTIGYAAPGAVLAVGILIPFAWADNRLADLILSLTGTDPGLLLTGTSFALILAFCIRFFAIAQGAADSALEQIPPSLSMAARSLGRNNAATLREVHVPLIRKSIGTALLLVFVDCVKELPATLLLRPFNFNTLATRVYEQASLENLEEAAPSALMIICVGCIAVAFLAKTRNAK